MDNYPQDQLFTKDITKLQRNRYTAKISRQRKKYYIELLEKKLEQLLEEKTDNFEKRKTEVT